MNRDSDEPLFMACGVLSRQVGTVSLVRKGSAVTVPVTARGQETRTRLLTAAERIFGEKSYFQVTIADITREAGVGLGTFYLYFPSKEAAFREVVQCRAHELRMATRLASEGARNRLEAERASFAAFFEGISKHAPLYRIVRQAEFLEGRCGRDGDGSARGNRFDPD